MKRGNLLAEPPPVVHLDWHVLYIDPEYGEWWRKYAWRFAHRFHLTEMMKVLLRQKRQIGNWIEMRANEYAFVVVVVGTKALERAVWRAVWRDKLWLQKIVHAVDWGTYGQDARSTTKLVEFVVPVEVQVPLLQGVKVVPYQGWGHQVGRAV